MPLSEKDKALVFENRGANPGTHVLIIGIGEYPHLIRGENENTAIAEGMEQLDAPPISARAVAKWFLDNFENPERPLASLAMVFTLIRSPLPSPLASANTLIIRSVDRLTAQE